MKEIFSQALGIVDPWFIKSVNFDVEKKRLDVNIGNY
jgi:hypothetical protein